MEVKYLVGIVVVLLTFVGYVPYIRDIIKGKTKPHVYTWFLWGLVTSIAFALQISDRAGIGSLVTLAAAIVCFIIFFFGMRIGEKNITFSDKISLSGFGSYCGLGFYKTASNFCGHSFSS